MPDDPEDLKELKKAIQETKEDLQKRMADALARKVEVLQIARSG